MGEMIEERRDAKAQGVERADVFTNLLNASESEEGDGGALSDLELNGTSSPFCLGCILTGPSMAGDIVSPSLIIKNSTLTGF